MATFPLDADDPRAVGPYVVQARLGEGGMGVVYLAEGPTGRVALKVVRRLLATDDTFRTRFRREVQAARRVRGRGVVELLDADTEGARPYLAMAYVDGPTLMEAVTRDGPLTGDRLRALSVALAEAMATIHRAGVTHRDLKPSNVLLTEDQPVVVDFGVATANEATSITVAGTVLGSPGWMAPEQITGGPPSVAMDVFAWGSLVAWSATGRNPFGSGRPEAVAYRIIHDEPDLTGVPADLLPVLSDALQKDPTARPTADALLARLLDEDPRAKPEVLAADATALLARTWVLTPVQPPLPSPPPPRPRRLKRIGVVVAVLVLSAAAGLGIGLVIREYQDRQDHPSGGEDFAGPPDDETPPVVETTTTTTTTTTTIPTLPVTVRWVIADDAGRTVGEPCTADPPYDSTAAVSIETDQGEALADPVAVGEGVAELGTGILDDVFGNTSCVYTVNFDAVPESDAYVIVPSTGDEPATFSAADLDAAGREVELVTNIGFF